ncbi:hypothetical protein DCAR_0207137 [Daucus carota subsp. sativus]|uniref:Uncharacterized protein n=1 Tax=Daucus carota subsp. sativus TaxID=79200 RepID=A0A161Y7M8_DAUCS|nr:PREDICTED: nuclear transcription factor Y subunit B-9-like [Daucus carota subsp. sativus]WOG87904.1 hypothetical protein DCAR_0207137 [Daucus carota subsp. sativus]
MKRTHEERENFECHENSSEQRISNDLVPAPNVTGLMRRIILNQGEISADAVISIQQCVIKFIRYVTAEANARCGEGMRTTMTAHDVLIALNKLGFHHYIGPLFIYMNRFQEFQAEQGDPPVIRRHYSSPEVWGLVHQVLTLKG